MYITDKAEIVIDASLEEIWEYVTDPAHWTASNPEEHYGLEYDTPDNRPHEGARFHQRETVASMYANLYGQFPYVNRPNVAVWVGTAYYPLLRGLVTVRIPEGGTIRLEETDDGTRMSHTVWMDFPNSQLGYLLKWLFENVLDGRVKLYDHTEKELVFFKEQIESVTSPPETSIRSTVRKLKRIMTNSSRTPSE
ncbi:SRPBCC family protein [Halomicrococcus sp. NG-SE-24]|uniref:SRPBCC family protein n=1 Tax=Halomicrococcus sp. NG-SE-24 TaxID=3436928 RepID=UPI003D95F826